MKKKRIALIGLDGSGKSANINNMKVDSDYLDFNFVWVRWKPMLLKPVYILLNKKIDTRNNAAYMKTKNQQDMKKVQSQEELNKSYNSKYSIKKKIFKSPVIRALWIFTAVIDYYIQFYLKVFKLLISTKSIVFDRYYIDLFVDQGINFESTPGQIAAMIKKYQWLFPKMNKVIYIRVSPEVCFLRKNDIPNMDYLIMRYEVYEYLSKKEKWTIVDGEQPLEAVYENIKRQIFNI